MSDASVSARIEPELGEYQLTHFARAQCQSLGLDEGLLPMFAHLAARVTHPGGEYRYGDYVLDIEGSTIRSIVPYSSQPICPDCHGTGKHRQLDGAQWYDVPCQHPQCLTNRT